jgi:hypothetical protein
MFTLPGWRGYTVHAKNVVEAAGRTKGLSVSTTTTGSTAKAGVALTRVVPNAHARPSSRRTLMFAPLTTLRLVPVYTSTIVQHKGSGPMPLPTTDRRLAVRRALSVRPMTEDTPRPPTQ